MSSFPDCIFIDDSSYFSKLCLGVVGSSLSMDAIHSFLQSLIFLMSVTDSDYDLKLKSLITDTANSGEEVIALTAYSEMLKVDLTSLKLFTTVNSESLLPFFYRGRYNDLMVLECVYRS